MPFDGLGRLELDAFSLVFVAAALFCGGVVRGFTGFGASMIWVASLSMVLSPVAAVPIVLMLEVASSARLLPQVFREVNWRSVRWVFLGAAVCLPIGISLLIAVPADPLRLAIFVTILAATFMVWRGVRFDALPGPRVAIGVGALSGLLNGATTIGGPPVILFYFSSPIGVAISRATVIAYFLGLDATTAGLMFLNGLIVPTTLIRTLVFLPPVLVGIAVGSRVFARTNPQIFRRVVLIVLALLALVGMARVAYSQLGGA